MRLTTVALAVVGASAFSAFAQVPQGVELYGRLNLGVDQYQAKGAAAGSAFDFKSRTRVFDTASRVGLRGSESLGGGLRAIFQIETGVNVDNGSNTGQNGLANPNTGFWASRDSWVGIEGDNFGRLTFGRQSVYWANGTIEQIGANYINASSPLDTFNLSGVVIGPVSRESNTVQYSLRFGGFSATASYGLSTAVAAGSFSQENAPANVDPRDEFYGITGRYNHAAFDVQIDYATRNDVANVKGRDFEGVKVGAAWKYMPGAQISVIYQQLKNKNVLGLGVVNLTGTACTPGAALGLGLTATGGGGAVAGCDTLKQNSWVASWEHTFGNVQLMAQYGWASDVKGSSAAAGLNDSGVRTYLIGARYLLSKRTWIYASYNQIRNDRNNYVDFWGGWMTSAANGAAPGLPATASGADPRIVAIGLFHAF